MSVCSVWHVRARAQRTNLPSALQSSIEHVLTQPGSGASPNSPELEGELHREDSPSLSLTRFKLTCAFVGIVAAPLCSTSELTTMAGARARCRLA